MESDFAGTFFSFFTDRKKDPLLDLDGEKDTEKRSAFGTLGAQQGWIYVYIYIYICIYIYIYTHYFKQIDRKNR